MDCGIRGMEYGSRNMEFSIGRWNVGEEKPNPAPEDGILPRKTQIRWRKTESAPGRWNSVVEKPNSASEDGI